MNKKWYFREWTKLSVKSLENICSERLENIVRGRHTSRSEAMLIKIKMHRKVTIANIILLNPPWYFTIIYLLVK